MTDRLIRFLLQSAPVRGEIVRLDASWREVVARHPLPASVRDRLGELAAAAGLLSASLKFDGSLVLQIHGDGPVSLLVVEARSDGTYRAAVKLRGNTAIDPEAGLRALVNANGRGRFVVTLDPRVRTGTRQPYQGVVPFEGDTVAEVLERYMERSEQVPTRLWLAADGDRATGLLLQRLPGDGGRAQNAPPDPDAWNRMQKLAETISRDELLTLSPEESLKRLFWQESLHAFDAREVRFHCGCSREKVADMLRMLGRAEAESIVAEQGAIDVRCEYCNAPYRFDAVDSARLFVSEPQAPSSSARH